MKIKKLVESKVVDEGIFSKKNSAEHRNAMREFDVAVEGVSKGENLSEIAHSLTTNLKETIGQYKYQEEKKANHMTNTGSMRKMFESKATAILSIYEGLIKTLKKPNNFYQAYSVIHNAAGKIAGSYKDACDGYKAIAPYGKILADVGNIQADKKVKKEAMENFFKKIVYNLNFDYNVLKKKPKYTLFESIIKESVEDAPYTKEEIEMDLKSLTNNFTKKEGSLKCGFEEEKISAVEILKKHYNVVEVSGDDRNNDFWYVIEYAEPKTLKESNAFSDGTYTVIDAGSSWKIKDGNGNWLDVEFENDKEATEYIDELQKKESLKESLGKKLENIFELKVGDKLIHYAEEFDGTTKEECEVTSVEDGEAMAKNLRDKSIRYLIDDDTKDLFYHIKESIDEAMSIHYSDSTIQHMLEILRKNLAEYLQLQKEFPEDAEYYQAEIDKCKEQISELVEAVGGKVVDESFGNGNAEGGFIDTAKRPGGHTDGSGTNHKSLEGKKTKTVKAKDLKPGMITDTGKILKVRDAGWVRGKPAVEVSYGGIGVGGSNASDTVDADRDYEVLDESLVESAEEEAPAGPEPGADTGIASMLIKAINDEWITIDYYNSVVATLEAEGFDDMIETIRDITKEEHLHVGQLQALLQTISPNTKDIAEGEAEAEQQMKEKVTI